MERSDGFPLDEVEMATWISFLRVATRSVERLDRELQEAHGLTLSDYEILAFLSQAQDERMQMTELASNALLSQSRLTYRVDRLVAEGLLERIRCPRDGRGVYARLTEAGLSKLKAAYEMHLAGVRRYVIDPSKPELAALNRSLSSMLSALEGSDQSREASQNVV